jgi:hypothetical protein
MAQIDSENMAHSVPELQALFVHRRFALPMALATAIAALAYDSGRRQ